MGEITIEFAATFRPWQVADPGATKEYLRYVYVDPAGWLVASDTFALTAVPCAVLGAPAGWPGLALPPGVLRHAGEGTRAGQLATVTVGDADATAHAPGRGALREALPTFVHNPLAEKWRALAREALAAGEEEPALDPNRLASVARALLGRRSPNADGTSLALLGTGGGRTLWVTARGADGRRGLGLVMGMREEAGTDALRAETEAALAVPRG